jgi:hypothetical protein
LKNHETIPNIIFPNHVSGYQYYPLNQGDSLGYFHSIVSNFVHLVLQRCKGFNIDFAPKNRLFHGLWLRCGYGVFNFKLFFMTPETQKQTKLHVIFFCIFAV